jgi:HEAT repeat protein
MGGLFAEADVDLGLALVRVLAGIRTPGAREAISMAVKSPHPVVRIEALGHVEGVSSERLRLELRALLEDREADVRIAALKAMEQYAIRVAGPFLVLRVKSPQFDSLPPAERRQAFQTLVALAPTRAEAAAVDVLKEGRVVTTDAHEESRAIAAETLARVASSADAMAALTEFSTARWKNSDRVRSAAQKALEELSQRAARAQSTQEAAGVRPRSPR